MPLRSKRHRRIARACAETLEGRQLLAATVSDGVWLITGDANRRAPGDVISIAPAMDDPQTLGVTVNGTAAGTTSISSITEIRIEAGRGQDRVTIDLGTGASSIHVTVLGGQGNDRITGAGEADTFIGGQGNDRIDTGGGIDVVFADNGHDQILGGDGDDELHGGGGNDVIAGGWGRDALFGDKGADKLRGGADDDSLDGGVGNDRLAGGDGADQLGGGKGADRVESQEGIDILVAPGSSPTRTVDRRDTVTADVVTTPATREEDDAQLKQWLIDAAVKQWKWAFDQPAYPWGYLYGIDGEIKVGRNTGSGAIPPTDPDPSPSPSPTPLPPTLGGDGVSNPRTDVDAGAGAEGGAGGAGGSDDHSDTNTQETGVDEADLAETDGDYIYTLRDQKLVILDATPAEGMTVLSRTAFEGFAVGIYLHGSRVTVVSATYNWVIEPVPLPTERGAIGVGDSIIAPPSEPPKAEVHVTVFDVSNRAAPTQVEHTAMEGSYNGSRLVGERLYLVISNDTWVPAPRIIPNPGTGDPTVPPPVDGDPAPGASLMPDIWRPGGDPNGVYESEASYRARLEAMPLSELLPSYHATSQSGDSSGPLINSSDSYVRDLAESDDVGQNLTTVTLLNVNDTVGGLTATTTVAGFGGTVYASSESLYIAAAQWDEQGNSNTRLLKFHLTPDAVPLIATGEVDGTVLNQFSMDEEGDTFRIATTGFTVDPNFPGGGTSTNSLFVLEQSGDELAVVGDILDIKHGERLQSARFVGDRAYLVTFRQVDPLFAVNLDDPTDPFIAGQLTIPGFSSYLQPIGDGLLLGLGRDIDSGTGRDKGLQLSLFDVSDDANPKRLDSIILSQRATSDAEWDHHAFSYFAQQGILALPVNVFADDFDYTGASQKLVVLRIDATQGDNAIQQLGAPTPPGGVLRSLRIGDVLYAVTGTHVQSVKLATPNDVLGTTEL